MADKPLLVITRPKLQAAALIAECQKQDIDFIHFPLFELLPEHDALAHLDSDIQAASAAFFVSPSAAEFAAGYIDWQRFSGSLIAVGAATAAVLEKISGKKVLFPADGGDSEAVLRLPLWQNPGKLLIAGAAGGRTLLAQTLRQRGWQVQTAWIYRREAQTLPEDFQAALARRAHGAAVLITSAEAARRWCAGVAAKYAKTFERLLYLSPHPRISAVLAENGMTHTVPCSAKPADIAAYLSSLRSQTHGNEKIETPCEKSTSD